MSVNAYRIGLVICCVLFATWLIALVWLVADARRTSGVARVVSASVFNVQPLHGLEIALERTESPFYERGK